FGAERPFSSLRRTVEHEALLALTARSYGLRTPALVALATAEPNAFVLAYEKIESKSLDGVAVEDLTDSFLRAIWTQVAELHGHRIAHATFGSRTCSWAATGRSGSSTSASASSPRRSCWSTRIAPSSSRRPRHESAPRARSTPRWTSSGRTRWPVSTAGSTRGRSA